MWQNFFLPYMILWMQLIEMHVFDWKFKNTKSNSILVEAFQYFYHFQY